MQAPALVPFETDDPCISLFGAVYATGALHFPRGARVLEIGCAEGDWLTPMHTVRPDLDLVGIDWRACESSRAGTVIKGDVLTETWPPESFDAVVGISSIEHIGLGHYERDPLDVDGDLHCMARVREWLRPGGLVYADVPYDHTYGVMGTSYRTYNEAALDARLFYGLQVVRRWYATLRPPDTGLHATPVWGPGLTYAATVAVKGGMTRVRAARDHVVITGGTVKEG